MASIKQQFSVFNLSEDSKLGFRSQRSNSQFVDWRNNPTIVPYREFVKGTIQLFLSQNASGDFTTEITMLAAYLESQLFIDALSEDDYMDQEKMFVRLQNLISWKWSEASFAQQDVMHVTNCSTNFDKPLDNRILSASAGCNLASAPKSLADVPRSVIYGSQHCITDTKLCQPEPGLPVNHSSGMSFANNGITYSGSDLLYDSMTSFGIRYNQNYSKGGIDLVNPYDQTSLYVRTPANVGENVRFVPAVSDGAHVHVRQQVLEPLQFKKQPFQFDTHSDEHFGAIVGSFSAQSMIPYASQGATSRISAIPSREVVKLLCSYIIYNIQGHEFSYLEILHSQMCKDDICHCEIFKFWLSHYDNCGSADCETCVSAEKICSAKFGFKGLTCGSVCGKRVRTLTSDDFINPTKFTKLSTSPGHDSPSDISAVTEEPISPYGPLNIEQLPASPVKATITKAGDNKGITTGPSEDASRIGKSNSYDQDDAKRSEFDDATIVCENPSADFLLVGESVASYDDDATATRTGSDGALDDIPESNSDDATQLSDYPSADMVTDNCCGSPFITVSNVCEDKIGTQNVEFVAGSDPQDTRPDTSNTDFLTRVASCTRMKTEKLTMEGVSLIDFFTAEEIRQHISSLKHKDNEDIAEGSMATRASCSLSENFCQLCGTDKLAFAPMPIYCSSCGGRIKNHASYYSTEDRSGAHFCFCSSCYNKCHRNAFTFQGVSILKSNLASKRNDVVTVEPWVQCDKCERWQHQICALFNDKKDLGGKAKYLCPLCHLEDLESGRHMPLPWSNSLDASNLSKTLLSDHLEQRILRSLKQEAENRAKAAGMKLEEVPQPADLFVRVVSSVDKVLRVKQQFLDIFPEKNYPAEFPYRSKVILLFQRIEGADVCLFAMYVQEFGSDCSQPNRRCVYISYLDSVKYFRPELKSVKGEALRTFVYHEILVGYLEYCKKRGFATCYIWACPPVKGEDYILYCHPETQKTPKPDKLRQWYQSMLKKAMEEKVVVNFSNLYEKFFVPTGDSNTKVTAARLPYFEGDYWSSVADNMIKKIELESGGDPQKKLQKITRRSLKAMGHSNPSADDAKDILLMQALAQNISSAKEDFIIVSLHYICAHCDEVILSGQRWFCTQCKNYQLCGRCQDLCQQSGSGNTHISSAGQIHVLSKDIVKDVPVDTEDNDVILDKCFLENRHAFLNFCQGNHYQFDSLRRAKHTSMMILYHLHNPNERDGTFCSLCFKDTYANPSWICEICPGFKVCSLCHERSDASCHSHTLIHQPTSIGGTESKVAELMEQLLDVLLHSSRCSLTLTQNCSYPNCVLLKRLFSHTHACNIRVPGGCRSCKKTWLILSMHSRRCKNPDCDIPRCTDLKIHLKSSKSKSIMKHKQMLPVA